MGGWEWLVRDDDGYTRIPVGRSRRLGAVRGLDRDLNRGLDKG